MIDLHNVSHNYGKKLALDNVSFSITGQEIIGIIGKNGSGKSSLLRVIAGLQRSKKGQIERKNLNALQIGYSSESFKFPNNESVRRIVKTLCLINEVKESTVIDTVRRLGLSSHYNVRTRKLSHGNKQKLNILCALIGRKRLVLFDEPHNALDPESLIIFRDIIRGLPGTDKSVLLASHNLFEVEQVCDKVVIMDNGKLLYFGDLGSLKSQFGTLEKAYLAKLDFENF